MATQILVIFIIRTNGRPWRDLPRPMLAASSLGALFVAMVLPFTPAARWFGFATPPLLATAGLGVIVLAYLISAELLKGVAVEKAGRHARPVGKGWPKHRHPTGRCVVSDAGSAKQTAAQSR